MNITCSAILSRNLHHFSARSRGDLEAKMVADDMDLHINAVLFGLLNTRLHHPGLEPNSTYPIYSILPLTCANSSLISQEYVHYRPNFDM